MVACWCLVMNRPEVVAAARRVLDASLGEPDLHAVGDPGGRSRPRRQYADLLPEETVQAILEERTALKGPRDAHRRVLVGQRRPQEAARPLRSGPPGAFPRGRRDRYDGIDLVGRPREHEGLYAGIENEITPGVVTSLKVATDRACRRIARFAFAYARDRGIAKVTAFHKANIMKLSDGLFIRCARRSRRVVHGHRVRGADHRRGLHAARAGSEPIPDCSSARISTATSTTPLRGFVGGLGVTPGRTSVRSARSSRRSTASPRTSPERSREPAIPMSGVMMFEHLAVTTGDEAVGRAAGRVRSAFDRALAEEAGPATSGDLATERSPMR